MKYAIFQALVIALVGAWSVWFALRRFFPRAYRAALARLFAPLARSSRPMLRDLATRAMPTQVASGAGCDSGGACSSCGTCAPAPALPGEAKPLVFHPRPKS
ncbi:MAG: DUF6587 family protein [Rudaea sp.]